MPHSEFQARACSPNGPALNKTRADFHRKTFSVQLAEFEFMNQRRVDVELRSQSSSYQRNPMLLFQKLVLENRKRQ